MTAIALGFVPEPITVSLDRILPSRKVPAGLATSRKFRQVKSSIEEVGLIEPLSVAALDAVSGHHLLLDGHVRLVALQALGHASAPCLVAKDDEGYTYNNRINRLSTIQEHVMIQRAVKQGVVTPAKLAEALDLSLSHLLSQVEQPNHDNPEQENR